MPASRGVDELLAALAGVLGTVSDGWYLFGAQAVQVRGILRTRSGSLDLARTRAVLAALEEALDQSDLIPLLEAQVSAVRRKAR